MGVEFFWGELFVIKLISIESGGMTFESEGGVSNLEKQFSNKEEFIKKILILYPLKLLMH